MNVTTPETLRSAVAFHIAAVLKADGVVVAAAQIGAAGLRVDLPTKADATEALAFLRRAGLRNGRAICERRGLWFVVGQLPE